MGRSHREMVYDPNYSGRRFKRFHRQSTSAARAEEAYQMGTASLHAWDLPKRWQSNPYPPGRRHDLYEQGRRDAEADRAEVRENMRYR